MPEDVDRCIFETETPDGVFELAVFDTLREMGEYSVKREMQLPVGSIIRRYKSTTEGPEMALR